MRRSCCKVWTGRSRWHTLMWRRGMLMCHHCRSLGPLTISPLKSFGIIFRVIRDRSGRRKRMETTISSWGLGRWRLSYMLLHWRLCLWRSMVGMLRWWLTSLLLLLVRDSPRREYRKRRSPPLASKCCTFVCIALLLRCRSITRWITCPVAAHCQIRLIYRSL